MMQSMSDTAPMTRSPSGPKPKAVSLYRDKELAGRMGDGGMFIASDQSEGQLQQVWKTFSLKLDQQMARCTVCNGELEPLAGEDAREGGRWRASS